MKHCYNFYKEELTWYINLPSWPGDKEELAMVLGADLMLEFLSDHTESVNVEFADEEFEENTGFLIMDKELAYIEEYLRESARGMGGAFYVFHDKDHSTYNDLSVWLCDVTKFVFQGEMPEKIWLRKV